MRLLLTFCCFLLLVRTGQAQERVRNVRIRVADSSQLEIRYDLINTRPGDSIYIEIKSRVRGTLRIFPEFVRGDVGKRIVAGSNRRIVWNALANGYSLNEEVRATVLVKTGLPVTPSRPARPVANTPPRPEGPHPANAPRPADPVTDSPAKPTVVAETAPPPPAPVDGRGNPDTTTARRKRYTGPAWALLSAVAPGFGNIFVQTPRPRIGLRPVLAVGCYSLLVYGLQERQKSRETYAIYLDQKNAEMAEPFYQAANSQYHRYYLATRGALVVAAADVILTFFKGVRNVRSIRTANRPQPSVSLRPGLQSGLPTAVVHYSF